MNLNSNKMQSCNRILKNDYLSHFLEITHGKSSGFTIKKWRVNCSALASKNVQQLFFVCYGYESIEITFCIHFYPYKRNLENFLPWKSGLAKPNRAQMQYRMPIPCNN